MRLSTQELEHARLTGKLSLAWQKPTELPPEIGRLTNLQALNLSGNRLTVLPPEIGRLTKLEWMRPQR